MYSCIIKCKAMKLLFLTLFSLGCVFSGSTQEISKKSKPKKSPISFTNTVIERNNITYGADETFTFEFKNTGKTPIIVSNVATSCGCTTAQKPEEPVKPGEKGVIVVKYDTKRIGNFSKDITVTTNVQEEPIVLQIKGSVAPQAQSN